MLSEWAIVEKLLLRFTKSKDIRLQGISVIMATNRIDSFLDEAVSSVFANQTIDLELVLVLDGIPVPNPKPDWMEDSRVTLLPKIKSSGLGAALNHGIKHAKYDLIARLDSDDNAYPTRFSKQLMVLDQPNPPILVGSQMVLIDQSGEQIGAAKQICGPDIRTHLLLQNVVPHSSYLLNKKDAFAIGLYREDLTQMEDYDFLLRLGLKGPIAVLCEPLIQYRVHDGQMSKKARWRGDYISVVLSGRKLLGREIGVSALKVIFLNATWQFIQFLRAQGLTKPRHLQNIRQTSSINKT